MTEREIQNTRAAARLYRDWGLQPIPSASRGTRKKPIVPYGAYWERPIPWNQWWENPDLRTRNLQVMTGSYTRLVVVDLDGPRAIAHWERRMGAIDRTPTWVVARDESVSVHLWFRLPDHVKRLPSKVIWKDGPHSQIDILADRKLATAPPSRHLGTGQMYRFLPGHSPSTGQDLAELPRWVIQAPDVTAPTRKTTTCLTQAPRSRKVTLPAASREHDRQAVLEALARTGSAVPIARSFGLEVVGRPNRSGWAPCRCISRPDREPSAGIHVETGSYSEEGQRAISFFDLLAALEPSLGDWRGALNHVGDQLHVRD